MPKLNSNMDAGIRVDRASNKGSVTDVVEETETRHIAMREASLRANASKVAADQLRDIPPGFKFVCAEDRGEPAMNNKIDVDDMPPGFRFLSDEDREQFAKQMVEQSLKRKRQEIEEKDISLKRKRCDNVMSCYSWMSDFGYEFEFDSPTVFHILDTMAVLTEVDVGVKGEVI